jgi:hypothetical protein
MPVNPYESPRAVEDNRIPQQGAPVLANAMISPIFVATAGIVGALLFDAVVKVLFSLEARDYSFHIAGCFGSAASFSVLMTADWCLHRKRPAWGWAVIGMLLAWPLALVIAVCLGFVAYGLATKGLFGSELVYTLCYASFFLTLSLGGWVAICRTQSNAISRNQISNGPTTAKCDC